MRYSISSATTLVTGGAGFIGSHVANYLLKEGHRVFVIDDLSGGYIDFVPAGASFVRGSILDVELISRLFREHRFDYVFHFAAYAAECLSHYIKRFNYTNNLIGSVNLINESVRYGVRCFVFASSAAVYGFHDVPVSEAMPTRPEDPYAIAKLATEQELRVTRQVFGLKSIIFRLHNVYGERQNLADRYRNVVGIFMRQALCGEPMTIFGDGNQTRSFSFVSDVVPFMVDSVKNPHCYDKVFNLGGGESTSVIDLSRYVAKAFKIEWRVQHLLPRLEAKHIQVDHSLAKRVLGFTPKTSLQEGIEKMAAWARTAPVHNPSRFEAIELTEHLPTNWRD